jgi:hypothetical protein
MIEMSSSEGFSDRPMCPDLDADLEPVLRAMVEVSPRRSTHGHLVCREF